MDGRKAGSGGYHKKGSQAAKVAGAGGGTTKAAKTAARKAAKAAARKAAIAKGVVHREDKFLLQTEQNKRQPCGTMQRHEPSANPGVAVLLFAAAHGALEDAAKAAGHGALEDAAKAAGHGALEDAAEVVVPRARKRDSKARAGRGPGMAEGGNWGEGRKEEIWGGRGSFFWLVILQKNCRGISWLKCKPAIAARSEA